MGEHADAGDELPTGGSLAAGAGACGVGWGVRRGCLIGAVTNRTVSLGRDEFVGAAAFFAGGAEHSVLVDVGACDVAHLPSFPAVLVGVELVDNAELHLVDDP